MDTVSDIRPPDWAFPALQSLVDRYGCTIDSTRSIRGDRVLSRDKFVTGLNVFINEIERLLKTDRNSVQPADLATLRKLQTEFSTELAQNPGDRGPVRAANAISQVLYPNSRGDSGLFGDTAQGVVELEYAPSKQMAVRLQYAGGRVLDNRFSAIGANLEWTLTPGVGVFGRYGYSWYDNTAFGNLNPQSWMAGVTFKDVFKPGAFAGLAVGQPFVERNVGTGTQTNFEAFYNFPVSENMRISSVVQVITNAGNQNSNGTIVTGTIRTVLLF